MAIDNDANVSLQTTITVEPKKTISILANGGRISSGVTGVKGSAETAYRTGLVSISPENLGIQTVQLENDAPGVITQAQLTILGNRVNGIIYKGYLYRFMAEDGNILRYSVGYLNDIDKLQILVINKTELTYNYILMNSKVDTHIADTSVHVQPGERQLWNQISNVQLSNLSPELVATIKQWIAEGGGKENQIVFATHSEFPAVGVVNKLYVAKDEHTAYLWDTVTYTYVIITTDYSDIETINGGGAAEE